MGLAPLRQRNFALLWWAGLISIAGNWALGIALPIYVLRLTNDPADVSAVVAAGLLGNVLFGAVAGAYVDRWDRRRVVIIINGSQAMILLPLLLVTSHDRVWIAVVVAFVERALTQFFQAAENALLPRLLPAEQLPAANSLNALNNNIGRLIGPALGGFAVTTLGLGGTAVLDAWTFVAAAALCVLITDGNYHAEEMAERHPVLRETVEGLDWIAHNRIVRGIFVLIAVGGVGEGMLGTLFAVYVTRALRSGGVEMGGMMSCQAVGGIIGALFAARITARFRPVPLIAISYAIFGLIDIVIFNYPRWSTTIWPVLILFALVGLPTGVHGSAIWTLFQLETPDRLRGRGFAAIWTFAAVTGIIGAVIAGWLGSTISAVDLLTVQGAGCVVAGLLFRVLAGRGPAPLAPPVPPVPAIPRQSEPTDATLPT
jgi:MFS family permease